MCSIIATIIIFSLIIFVHEFGHFITARFFKVLVHEFAIGMGPAIWKKKIGETLYSIRLIPIGGFCKMEGEDEYSESENSFSKKTWYARSIILVSGGFMNILLGFVLCFIMTFFQSNIPSVTVEKVEEQSPAKSFLQSGDKIVKINDSKVNIKRDIEFLMSNIKPTDSFELSVKRRGKTITETVKPFVIDTNNGEFSCIGFRAKAFKTNIFNAARESFYLTIWMIKLVIISIKMLFTGHARISEVSGVVGAASMLGKAAKTGVGELLFLSSFISVNIGLFNLFPIPALDGGRVLFILVELIRRKPLKAQHEGIVHFIGFAIFILLMIFATCNDIGRILFN